jgi:hypothetical protein
MISLPGAIDYSPEMSCLMTRGGGLATGDLFEGNLKGDRSRGKRIGGFCGDSLSFSLFALSFPS